MRTALRGLQIILALLLLAYLLYFADHARLLFGFAFPLDYGEGPLLAQVERLRTGVPIWHLYADPSLPPFLIINYPPLYLLLATALSYLTGSVLLAGRLISLFAALAAVLALARLARPTPASTQREAALLALGLSLLLLCVPVIREWAALMRVDMLGLALGLWAVVALGSPAAPRRPLLAGFLLLASLFTKPSLLAAPVAVLGWLLWDLLRRRGQSWRSLLVTVHTSPSLQVLTPRRKGAKSATKPLRLGAFASIRSFLSSKCEQLPLLLVLAPLLLGGSLLFGLLQWASGGWFALHVVAANANQWQPDLAWGFWQQQMRLRWPLGLAALVLLLFSPALRTSPAPLLYCLGALVSAVGVGKVGAYSNYFFELYAGLIWIVARGLVAAHLVSGSEGVPHRHSVAPWLLTAEDAEERRGRTRGILCFVPTGIAKLIPLRTSVSSAVDMLYHQRGGGASSRRSPSLPERQWGVPPRGHDALAPRRFLAPATYLLLILALLYYPPLWDPLLPRPAGLLNPSPPRLIVGRYGLWDDARREADLLAAFARVDAALGVEVRLAGQIFTDMPGMAAAFGVESRMQVFETRQLLDQGLADQSPLLAELAAGRPPLALIDYLGNWLTPQIVDLLRHRYAQDGSRGTFDLYRPVDAGPLQALDPPVLLADLRLLRYALAAPLSAAYEPGELLVLNLAWERGAATPSADLPVRLILTTPDGTPLLESSLPLLYAAFPPAQWPSGVEVQHLQTLALPPELPPGRYGLALALGNDPPLALTTLEVQSAGGHYFEATDYFVPAPMMQAWAELGALERLGLPLTPAVPFAWGRLQCFELGCLEWRAGTISLRPLGQQLYLGETMRATGCPAASMDDGICTGFAGLVEQHGASLGAGVSGEFERYGWTVQWSEYARLERWEARNAQGLGRLGEESLRLAPGIRYRWPVGGEE
ncbi:hypothetical protein [Candidatus Oscillochloris fontis]|uniref:hypothetical protein n=1 Tax=Candidatus Oscillochloris fontis TaxID=2496868 RepID=UPI001EE7DE0F|nr:hypothetical protein [Candidatus Oscillochloris fontis]